MGPLRTELKFMDIRIDSLNKTVHKRLNKALGFVVLYFCVTTLVTVSSLILMSEFEEFYDHEDE